MKTKYKTSTWSLEIEEVNIVLETEKFVTLDSGRRYGKDTNYTKLFDVKADAVNHLINIRLKEIERLRNVIDDKEIEIAQIIHKYRQ